MLFPSQSGKRGQCGPHLLPALPRLCLPAGHDLATQACAFRSPASAASPRLRQPATFQVDRFRGNFREESKDLLHLFLARFFCSGTAPRRKGETEAASSSLPSTGMEPPLSCTQRLERPLQLPLPGPAEHFSFSRSLKRSGSSALDWQIGAWLHVRSRFDQAALLGIAISGSASGWTCGTAHQCFAAAEHHLESELSSLAHTHLHERGDVLLRRRAPAPGESLLLYSLSRCNCLALCGSRLFGVPAALPPSAQPSARHSAGRSAICCGSAAAHAPGGDTKNGKEHAGH